MSTLGRFLRSKAGRILLVYVILAGVISATVASYFYTSSLNTFIAQKVDEKATTLQLVDAFVTNYSRLRSQFGENAPVPATFRAHSIETFNKQLGESGTFVLRWVGRPGREIKTPPIDAETAAMIEAFTTTTDRSPRSTLTSYRQPADPAHGLSVARQRAELRELPQPDSAEQIPVAAERRDGRVRDRRAGRRVPAEHQDAELHGRARPVPRARRHRPGDLDPAFPAVERAGSLDDAGADAGRALQCRAQQHVARLVHVRRRQAAGRMQRALCAPLFTAAGAVGTWCEARGDHPASYRERDPRAVGAGAIQDAEQALARRGFEPRRQVRRRPPDQGGTRADPWRRLGRHPRGHHRADAPRFRSIPRSPRSASASSGC